MGISMKVLSTNYLPLTISEVLAHEEARSHENSRGPLHQPWMRYLRSYALRHPDNLKFESSSPKNQNQKPANTEAAREAACDARRKDLGYVGNVLRALAAVGLSERKAQMLVD